MADEKKTTPPAGATPQAAAPEAPAKTEDARGGLPALIQQFARGETDATAVANAIRKDDPSRPSAELTYEQKEKRAMEDDNDYSDTFSEVVAAWIGGQITDAQYNELRTAFVPEGATTGEEDDAGEEEVESEEGSAPATQ